MLRRDDAGLACVHKVHYLSIENCQLCQITIKLGQVIQSGVLIR